MDAIEGQDQLKLALALSASMNPHHSTVQDTSLPTQGSKRGRHGKGRAANERNLPVTSSPITSEESRRLLARRASAMLEVSILSVYYQPMASILSVYSYRILVNFSILFLL